MSYYILLLFFNIGCRQTVSAQKEALYRKHDEYFMQPPQAMPQTRAPYPWEKNWQGAIKTLTPHFFCCKGSRQNPPIQVNGVFIYDCQPHGLPLDDKGDIAISDCLIDLLNGLQSHLGKKVHITTGHRCPTHNLYCDASALNRQSKHLIGAEVDFYIEGLEHDPMQVIQAIFDYYQKNYTDPAYTTFTRLEKENLNVKTKPWLNKAILIKLYLPDEGRDFDNQHPYPYIGIQDRNRQVERQTVENYHRHV